MGIIMLTPNAVNSNVKSISLLELYNSPLGCCMIPDNYGFRLLLQAGANVSDPAQYVGGGELFRLPAQGLVMVGEYGTIVSATPQALSRDVPTVVSKQINGDGYRVISSHYGCESFRVCRLVASVWVPGRDPAAGADEVDHLDGDRANDRAENLAWVTHSENIRRSYQRPNRRPRRKWTPDDLVLLLPRHPGVGNGHMIIAEARHVSRITGSTNVSHCLTYMDRCGCGDYYVVPVPRGMVLYMTHPDYQHREMYRYLFRRLLERVVSVGNDSRTDRQTAYADVLSTFGAFVTITLDKVKASPYWYSEGVA